MDFTASVIVALLIGSFGLTCLLSFCVAKLRERKNNGDTSEKYSEVELRPTVCRQCSLKSHNHVWTVGANSSRIKKSNTYGCQYISSTTGSLDHNFIQHSLPSSQVKDCSYSTDSQISQTSLSGKPLENKHNNPAQEKRRGVRSICIF